MIAMETSDGYQKMPWPFSFMMGNCSGFEPGAQQFQHFSANNIYFNSHQEFCSKLLARTRWKNWHLISDSSPRIHTGQRSWCWCLVTSTSSEPQEDATFWYETCDFALQLDASNCSEIPCHSSNAKERHTIFTPRNSSMAFRKDDHRLIFSSPLPTCFNTFGVESLYQFPNLMNLRSLGVENRNSFGPFFRPLSMKNGRPLRHGACALEGACRVQGTARGDGLASKATIFQPTKKATVLGEKPVGFSCRHLDFVFFCQKLFV